MLIAVIGQHEPSRQLDYLPWEIDILENGNTRVFGVTLQKTSIQDANQIFANFADTRLLVNSTESGSEKLELIARYNELTIGGLIAEINLAYDLDETSLKQLYHSAKTEQRHNNGAYLKLSSQDEMKLLNTPVKKITYIPSIDYGEEILRQRFGQAAEERVINETTAHWIYPELGLTIIVRQDQADEFIYSKLK